VRRLIIELYSLLNLAQGFRNVLLSTDRATRSVDDYNIPSDIVDEVQCEADDTISTVAADTTTIPATATEMGDPEED
jgi:hypothetical protein